MRRVISAALGLTMLAALSGMASATSSLTSNSFTVGLYTDSGANTAFTDVDKAAFFNQAACQCAKPFFVKIAGTSGFPSDADNLSVEVWVGTGCDVATTRTSANCTMMEPSFQVSKLHTTSEIVSSTAKLASGDCTVAFEGTKNIYVLVDGNANSAYMDAGDVDIITPLVIDTKPPSAPTGGVIKSGDSQLHVSFDYKATGEDVRGFQLLCSPKPESAATTLIDVCTTGTTMLDLTQLCGGTSSATDREIDSDTTLTNGMAYTVSVISFDGHKNPSLPLVISGMGTPQPSTDFFNKYRQDGGHEDGGYCFVATAAWGDYNHPAVRVLRDFRDQILARTLPGRWLIRAYYWISPPFAAFIRLSPVLRLAARIVLWPIVILAGLVTYAGPLGRVLLLLALILGIVLRRRLRRQAPRARRTVRWARALPALGFLLVLAAVSPAFADDAPPPPDNAPAAGEPPPTTTEPEPPPGDTTPAPQPVAEPLPPPTNGPPITVEDEHSDFYGEPPRPTDNAWARGRYLLDIKLGPYHPDVDAEPGVTGHPYDALFGSGPTILSALEVGVAAYRGPLGWIGLSGSVGYLSDSAPALSDAGGTTGDTTSFTMVPFTLSGVWRFDQLAERWNIPVVPYGKLGLATSLWWSKNGAGHDSTVKDTNDKVIGTARGSIYGYQAELGVQVLLDGLDPTTSRNFAADLGIQHFYAFVELLDVKLDNFGAKDRIHLGDTTWLAGIAFEM